MKYSEFHRWIKRNDWQVLLIAGRHYINEKKVKTYQVPYHGSKEMSEPLRKKIIKEMGLK